MGLKVKPKVQKKADDDEQDKQDEGPPKDD